MLWQQFTLPTKAYKMRDVGIKTEKMELESAILNKNRMGIYLEFQDRILQFVCKLNIKCTLCIASQWRNLESMRLPVHSHTIAHTHGIHCLCNKDPTLSPTCTDRQTDTHTHRHTYLTPHDVLYGSAHLITNKKPNARSPP